MTLKPLYHPCNWIYFIFYLSIYPSTSLTSDHRCPADIHHALKDLQIRFKPFRERKLRCRALDIYVIFTRWKRQEYIKSSLLKFKIFMKLLRALRCKFCMNYIRYIVCYSTSSLVRRTYNLINLIRYGFRTNTILVSQFNLF